MIYSTHSVGSVNCCCMYYVTWCLYIETCFYLLCFVCVEADDLPKGVVKVRIVCLFVFVCSLYVRMQWNLSINTPRDLSGEYGSSTCTVWM